MASTDEEFKGLLVILDKCSSQDDQACLGTPDEIDQYFADINGIAVVVNANYVDYQDIDDPIKSRPLRSEYPIGPIDQLTIE